MVLHARQTQMQPGPQRHYLALYLPRWATDCLKRHDRSLEDLEAPLVLYERLNNAMRLVALDAKAEAAGLFSGQMLSDARAVCPALVAREIDRDFTEGVFADFADWHFNASPIVAIADDWAAYGDLILDITGVAHLFGGMAEMLRFATGRLAGLGFAVQGAIAPTIGAAMGLSHYAPGRVVDGDNDELADALAPLPIAGLRLAPEQIAGLNRMGLKTIGQLYGRDRGALTARFGVAVLTRIDQALGHAEERPRPRQPAPDLYCDRKFAEPIGLIEDVLMSIGDLSHQLCGLLAGEGLGAQCFRLMLFRVDHKMMTLSVTAARGLRDPGHITRLFTNRIERLKTDFDAGFGIDMIRLAADETSGLDAQQTGAFGMPDGAADLDRLYDRLTSRLGAGTIVQPVFVNTHIPERAVALQPALAHPQSDPLATPDIGLPRPLRLLPHPEPVEVVAEVPDGPPARMVWRRVRYRFVKAAGPERIGHEWWQPGEAALTRDYFTGEDEEGRRFWLFREGLYASEAGAPRWFMHGVFA